MRRKHKSYQGFWKDNGEEDGKMRIENDGEEHYVEEDDGETARCTFTQSISQCNQ